MSDKSDKQDDDRDWERLRAVAAKLVRNVDPREPRRLGHKPSNGENCLSPSGEPILRYYNAQAAARVRAPAAGSMGFPYYDTFAAALEVEKAQRRERRVVALLLDCSLPQLPTLEQQYAIVRRYVDAHPLLLWDGWADTAVQWLRPELATSTISNTQGLEYALYYAHHAAHVVIVSLTSLSVRHDYSRLPLLAAGCNKTLAVLDVGLDTHAHPRQLPALAATHMARVTSPLNAQLGAKLTRCKRALGWRPNPDGSSSRPDDAYRSAARLLAGAIESDRASAQAWTTNDATRVLQRYFPAESRIGGRLLLISSIYLAHKLNWPERLNRTIAKSLVRFADLDVLSGQPFDVAKARQMYERLDRSLTEGHMSLVYANSRRYKNEVVKIMRERYQPPVPASWIVAGLADVPAAPGDMRELPQWLIKQDEFARAGQILKEIGDTHLRDDDELVAGLASILCQASLTIGDVGEFEPPIDKKRTRAKYASSSGASSSTAPSATAPD